MRRSQPNALARSVRYFFTEHLCALRGLSPHTVCSYRDTFSLLLRFAADQRQCPAATLDLDDLDSVLILAFLQHLEDARGNSSATRNVRLAALHAFFCHLPGQYPERLEQSQRILAIPFKRTQSHAVEYLEHEEIQAVLAAVDRSTSDGRRDYALIATMFNTGGRVQEILDLRPCDLQLIRPLMRGSSARAARSDCAPCGPRQLGCFEIF